MVILIEQNGHLLQPVIVTLCRLPSLPTLGTVRVKLSVGHTKAADVKNALLCVHTQPQTSVYGLHQSGLSFLTSHLIIETH